jgi:hypothetical protein
MRVAGNLMMSCLAAIATGGPGSESSDADMSTMADASVQMQAAMVGGPTIRNPLAASRSSFDLSSDSMWTMPVFWAVERKATRACLLVSHKRTPRPRNAGAGGQAQIIGRCRRRAARPEGGARR